MLRVRLYSDAYEAEFFAYDTLEEALDGLARLVRRSLAEFAQDGIAREVTFMVGGPDDETKSEEEEAIG
jgi:hypothetical protein